MLNQTLYLMDILRNHQPYQGCYSLAHYKGLLRTGGTLFWANCYFFEEKRIFVKRSEQAEVHKHFE
jgi:hypothetical protein